MQLLEVTNSKWYTTCLIAAIAITLSVNEGHFPIANVFKCDFLYLWRVARPLCGASSKFKQAFRHKVSRWLFPFRHCFRFAYAHIPWRTEPVLPNRTHYAATSAFSTNSLRSSWCCVPAACINKLRDHVDLLENLLSLCRRLGPALM